MSVPADEHTRRTADEHGVLTVRGPQAAKFLQGQLSADVEQLAPGARTLAGLHNPQGRVIAVLALLRASEQEFVAALPRELVEPVAQRLRKYVLRAKVEVVSGGENAEARFPADATSSLDAVRAGMPQVYASTSEQFVAQMLNLDLVGAISFDKGCYTGQEVIARAHYRGRVKRRMQRWRNDGGVPLRPGDSARARDGRALAVVRVAQLDGGHQELLAVGNFGPLAEPEANTTADGVIVDGPLPLPYSLPE